MTEMTSFDSKTTLIRDNPSSRTAVVRTLHFSMCTVYCLQLLSVWWLWRWSYSLGSGVNGNSFKTLCNLVFLYSRTCDVKPTWWETTFSPPEVCLFIFPGIWTPDQGPPVCQDHILPYDGDGLKRGVPLYCLLSVTRRNIFHLFLYG